MLVSRDLKLLTPLLAAKPNNDRENPKRIFIRPRRVKDDDGMVHIQTQMPLWDWLFLEARDALRESMALEEVNTSSIVPAHYYSVKKTSTYNRKYRRGRGQPQVDRFESLPTGQVITMRFTLSRQIPPWSDGGGRFNRPPDAEELDAMLEHIGEYLGISEWGRRYGYGRFHLYGGSTTGEDVE